MLPFLKILSAVSLLGPALGRILSPASETNFAFGVSSARPVKLRSEIAVCEQCRIAWLKGKAEQCCKLCGTMLVDYHASSNGKRIVYLRPKPVIPSHPLTELPLVALSKQ